MKTCSQCHTRKSLSEFYRLSTAKDGKRSECKKCADGRTKVYVIAHRKEISKKQLIRAHKRRLEAVRPPCAQCGGKIGLWKRKFCSRLCRSKCFSELYKRSGKRKEDWLKQKATPGYKEYHREVARRWLRKHSAIQKGF